MNSSDLTYPARVTVVAADGLNASSCHHAAKVEAGLPTGAIRTSWGDYIEDRCVIAGEFSRDVGVFVIHPDHDRDEFLGELLMTMARGDTERFVELCRTKGWV